MKFIIDNPATLDPAALADELITAMGSNFGISTAGCVITTSTEPDAAAFQAVLNAHIAAATTRPIKKAAKENIDRLERECMLPRVTREFMLSYMELNATPAQLASNIGYQKVKALDDSIRAERAKLV